MSTAVQTLECVIYEIQPAFDAVKVGGVNFEREAGFATQIIAKNDYLLRIALSNRRSVIDAVTNVAAIGVSLNPATKQAYLVPRKGAVCLDISYQGLMDLAIDSGSILWGQARLVCEADTFEMQGIDREPIHRFRPFAKDRGSIVGVYVVVKTHNGDYLTEAMSLDEVYAIRDRSEAWKTWIEKEKTCPWVTDEGEMVKKTVVKRASKYWPATERLAKAVHHLNTEGGEGLAPETNSLLDEWIDKVNAARSTEDLTAVWQAGVKAFNAAKDRSGGEAFKAAVIERHNAVAKPVIKEGQ